MMGKYSVYAISVFISAVLQTQSSQAQSLRGQQPRTIHDNIYTRGRGNGIDMDLRINTNRAKVGKFNRSKGMNMGMSKGMGMSKNMGMSKGMGMSKSKSKSKSSSTKFASSDMAEVPIVGGVTMESAVVGFRVTAPASVAVRYTSDPLFQSGIMTMGPVLTSADSDYTGSIRLTGLQPNTRYFYRLVVDGSERQPADNAFATGSDYFFQTFSPTGMPAEIVFFADTANVRTNQPAPVYEKGKDALVALQIGDLDHSGPQELSEYRAMHWNLRSPHLNHGRDLGTYILSRMAFDHVWDDHDFCGNDSDKTCASKLEARRAYTEYYPGYDKPNPSSGIYHKFTVADAEVFVLDTRYERDPDTAPDDSNKSMLGAVQKTWLLEGLRDSASQWKIVVSSVSANTVARPGNIDHWGSFQTEANEIRDWIQSRNLSGIVMVSGDLHTGGGVDDGSHNRWGVPELGTAHTNLQNGNANNIGTWSEGVTPGAGVNNKGYGSILVAPTTLTLQAKNLFGDVLHSLTLTA